MIDRTQANRNRSNAARLAAYATAATGAALGVSSSADAAAVVVNISTENAATNFTIDLTAAGLGASNFTFSNIGLASAFYARISAFNQFDTLQFVATAMVGTGIFLDANDGWSGVQRLFIGVPGNGETKYLGFRLTVGEGDSRYGWIEYVNNGTSTTVSRWAYESQLNTGITTPTASAVPGGAGLAALAFGAAGLRGRRRSRN